MKTVLIVEDDLTLQRTLYRYLSSEGFEVHVTDTVAEADSILRSSNIDVLLADLRIQDGDGLDLLRSASQISSRVRPILMSAFATARDHEAATGLGAVRVLNKPFTHEQLLAAVHQAIETEQGFRGSIHGLSLVDLLQMYHFAKRSIELSIGGPSPGVIVMERGEIVHAAQGEIQGEVALRALLKAESGSIRTTPLVESAVQTIERGFEQLLLDTMRALDEQDRPAAGDSWIERLTFNPPPPAENTGEGVLFQADPEHPWDVETSNQGASETMGKIDDACKQVVEKVDGAAACGVVDLDSGMLLGIYNAAAYTQTLNEVVAAATMDLFRGPNVGRIEQMVRSHRGMEENGEHYFEEMHITSKHNYHFAKVLRGGKAVIMLVTKKTTNIGMGWAMLKSVIPEVEPHIP
jgi:CheY-like chemotaxis protein